MNTHRALSGLTWIVVAGALCLTGPKLKASGTDDRIESSAKATHIYQTFLKGDDITIRSQDGIVTLSGTVESASHRALAEEAVVDLPGVRLVKNRIEVEGESASPNSDVWIWDKVKTTLLFHKSVSAFHTEVSVQSGVVTLEGVASSEGERRLAAEYASDVDGVVTVVNKMTVAPEPRRTGRTMGEKMDDASISAQVRVALQYHRSTRSIPTHVKTVLGVVTVHGTARSLAEKQRVSKVAGDINGVVSVQNEMVMEKAR